MAHTRVAVGGALLLLGVANVAVLDFHFAPRLVEEMAVAEALSTKKPDRPAPSVAIVDATTAPKPVAPPTAPPTVAVAPPVTASVAPPTTASAVAVAPTADPAPQPPVTPPSSAPDAVPDLAFDLDSSRINRESSLVLDKAVEALKQHPNVRVLVRGHSDRLGSFEYNLELSRRRASAVEAYLVEHGVAADRISTEALGGKEPMDSNNSPVAWARNRRVQVIWR
jgi:outer membrane protein OmpA-like peptidoglycan-associated protein